MPSFTAQVFQNEYLPERDGTVDAVVTVTAGEDVTPAATEAVEILILDRSGSMNEEGGAKIRAAREAACAAIDQLRDDVWFAVLGGNTTTELVYPDLSEGLARSSRVTREQAQRRIKRVQAEEGTAIGGWLLTAGGLFAQRPAAIHHAILLTDGKNQHESAQDLDAALARCAGVFQCDCRGLGADWNVAELRRIASTLLGSVDIIPHPSQMEQEFRSLIEAAMQKGVAAVSLRLWAPQGSKVEFVKQVSPNIEDLTGKAVPVNALTGDVPLGSWSAGESRDYHVQVTIPPGNVGDERLAARVMLMLGDQQVSAGLVKAIWTDDERLSTRINREVAHYTGQAELAEAIADGLAAHEAGDERTATVRLGRAVQLAHESGNDDTVQLLRQVVDVDDAESGTVRLKPNVDKLTAMTLDTRSTRTVRVNKGS
ncbi:MAG: hypothetical protein QOJ19_218 [Acidimicrobiia bacterium]|jgi:hypothetical protein|nr:hypothetical protein [Acidimicrobiia bacterium]